ncbi:MAG: hypothetical protein IJI45_17250 [Anaerolineaceae bacterium]|nr:hypothetical protein [Anaerolineaceae bacterium]
MEKVIPEILDYYDKEVEQSISQKNGYSHFDALRLFVLSETHHMLENPKLEMQEFAPGALTACLQPVNIRGEG